MYDEENFEQEQEEEYQSAGAEKPFDIVHKNIGENVTLVLKDGRKIDGVLVGYDLELNLVLEKAQVIRGEDVKRIGVAIIRRNNILAIEDHVLL
ncbi:MAG: putative snRNP Sm-like protein [Candidatus Methanofastidiosum methylothiophilum]|jgi:small nuclear ribonucleoprotein (snRNP)-like protein|uniref:Putative snRNP Sm-like protein n=1 Tax=Candidatus Methanofastidiosum methylothiophilum TaxID=1705564 RepID=A0A150JAD9_9EURY|nr:MAG: putative snRNP Sm-like protein [Candidatus Methanofastidiosum methylthiophilus]NMC76779.1 small nuclear ribonucleoprotein [Candidatus Methanofastidiosa archaeon]